MSIKNKYRVESIKKEQSYEWLLYKHYAKRLPSISYAFGLFKKDVLVGVCTYGIPASDQLLRCCGDEYKQTAFELNRLIKNDGLEKNTQSYFVAQTFKLLPKPKIIISYSDPNNGHNGYTYQSLNFLYTGKGGGTGEYKINNKQIHARHMNKSWFIKNKLYYDDSLTFNKNFERIGGVIIKTKPKNRYIMFLGSKTQKKNMLKNLKYDIKPYPKGDNDNYDTGYKPTTQGVLF